MCIFCSFFNINNSNCILHNIYCDSYNNCDDFVSIFDYCDKNFTGL